jgi:hypothetical protein
MFDKLSEAKKWLGYQTQVWGAPPSLRWFADEPGGVAFWHREKRRRVDVPAAEYSENDTTKLAELVTYCRAVIVRMEEVITLAEERIADLKAVS